jgi:hypothetical protein
MPCGQLSQAHLKSPKWLRRWERMIKQSARKEHFTWQAKAKKLRAKAHFWFAAPEPGLGIFSYMGINFYLSVFLIRLTY